MSFVPWPNGVQLCFDFLTAGQNWQFCLGLRKSAGAPTTQDLEDVATEGADWWTALLDGAMDSTTQLRQVRATDMTAQGAEQRIVSVGTSGGGGTNQPLPLNAATCVSMRTAKRGRAFRGRAYIGGLTQGFRESAVTMTTGFVSALAGHFVSLQNTLDGLGFDMVVATRQINGQPLATAQLNEVVEFIIDQAIDSQRRRLQGRGT